MDNNQEMRDIWNEITIPTLINNVEKKEVIQEIMHDDIPSKKQNLKESDISINIQ